MNKLPSAKLMARLAALVISILLYGFAMALIAFWVDQFTDESRTSAVELSLTWSETPRIEQVAVEEPPPPVELEEPPPEEADVALEEVVEEPEPEPEPVVAEAQVTQEAAAPEPVHEKDALVAWVYAQVEKQKYYPAAARRSGVEGEIRFRLVVDSDGVISSAEMLPGGHFLLRRALGRMIGSLPGQRFPGTLTEKVVLEVPFEFELK